jgi:hypothetical protein
MLGEKPVIFRSLSETYKKAEALFGSLKFAVIILSLFALALFYGTFMESYHGTDYANRLVYKSLPFMLLQAAMFLSILAATLQRLPFRKALAGFYVLHLGLLLLFLGSYITYVAGIDGNLTLAPNSPASNVLLPVDQLTIQFPEKKQELTLPLPYSAGPVDLQTTYEQIKLHQFLPFAEMQTQFKDDPQAQPSKMHSAQYFLYNDMVQQELTLSLHPETDFTSSERLGPLSVHYLPQSLGSCFAKNSLEGYLFWNALTEECLAADSAFTQVSKLAGKTQLKVQLGREKILFLPDLSPMPVLEKGQIDESSPWRMFSRKLFQEQPHLFLFGEAVSFFDKETQKWNLRELTKTQEVALPWMNFKLKLLQFSPKAYPVKVPVSIKPIQENGQLIKGQTRALEVEVENEKFWLTSSGPMSFRGEQGKIIFDLHKKTLKLPFEITLDRFQMQTDPGTQNPASYESFISLFQGNQGSQKHHVFMNNPLKHSAFTFYQASYFEAQENVYGSVLSVNYDPGRSWKYLGSLLLVLGSLWHFVLRRKFLQKVKPA